MPDNLTPEQRRYCMSHCRGKDTKPELAVRSELHRRGLRYRKHVAKLPGKPDIVFPRAKIAVFIDGDFWHGYRFPLWRQKLTPQWEDKISKTRARDKENFRRLRQDGWQVIRLWQHEVKSDLCGCVLRIIEAVRSNTAA